MRKQQAGLEYSLVSSVRANYFSLSFPFTFYFIPPTHFCSWRKIENDAFMARKNFMENVTMNGDDYFWTKHVQKWIGDGQ